MTTNALDVRFLAQVTHRTSPLFLVLLGIHCELVQLNLISSPCTSLVLGHSWLEKHNPQIEWLAGRVVNWSSFCHFFCLKLALPHITAATTPSDLLSEVVSKDWALSLPPQRHYDCAIDLLPGATLPSGQLYNLSYPEDIERYINDSLTAGII